MFFSSCRSNKIVEKRIYYIPEIDFPDPPKLPEYEILEDGRIATEEEFFRRYLSFKTLYSDTILKYNEKKNKLEDK